MIAMYVIFYISIFLLIISIGIELLCLMTYINKKCDSHISYKLTVMSTIFGVVGLICSIIVLLSIFMPATETIYSGKDYNIEDMSETIVISEYENLDPDENYDYIVKEEYLFSEDKFIYHTNSELWEDGFDEFEKFRIEQ